MRVLRQLLDGGEEGYTLIELVVVMAILGTVVAGLTTVFVSGSAAELDLNRRFQAQQQGRLGLNQLRSDIHCASAAQQQTIGTYPGLKLAVGSCYTTTPTISWCVVPVTTTPARYAVYRSTATSNICTSSDTTRTLITDYLTTDAGVFTTGNISKYALQTVAVDFKISVNPTTSKDVYELTDSIVARNSTRCTPASGVVCSPPAVP
jgi:prepilin-type N-terminal cleavage/methylation domain-containing protein